MRVPQDGGVKKLAALLNYLNQKCKMVWIVPSSTNLVDVSDIGSKNISNIVPAGQTTKYSYKDSALHYGRWR